MKLKPVFRYAPPERKLRLFRIIHGDDKTSWKLAVGLRPVLFRWQRDFNEWRLVLLGIDVHYRASYSGRLA